MARLPDKIPASQFNAALSFIQHIKAGLASSQTIHAELLHLLACLGRGETADTHAVLARADAILRGHPDLLQRFDAFLGRPSHHQAAKPVREDPVAAAPPPKRPKREHRRTVAECAGPMRFLERVKMADAGLYDMLLVLLFNVEMEGTLNAHQIYAKALEVFGSADSPLLRGFTEFLPLPTAGRDFLTRRRAKEEPEHGPKRKAVPAGKPSPSAAKKPRADHDRKTKSGSVSAFRDAWEFETTYSKLAVTLRRTEKSLEELEPRKESPEEVEPEAAPGHHGRPRTLEQLYPGRECQEVLQEMYGGMWGQMRVALEDGARTEVALRTILRRLTKLEQVAVKMAMGRRDPARVEARVKLLVLERRDGAHADGGMNKLNVEL
ncbi:hypothetical protein VPH35_068656 [Triticum aestivum]|uniref:Histone deacetylase interacting domain-containing protein n=1 Tax=Triticum aestivum TaxID=4565 RepID=A0A3B6I1L9_WHEAT|nr:uncharacterized protein LOC123082826 [Triticum aestivum]